MKSVSTFCHTLEVKLNTGPDVVDITSELIRLLQASKISGVVLSASMVIGTA